MSSSPGNVSSNLRIVSLGTLCSRVLGLARDVGMATLFGNGPVMDAFSVAFRLPNLARMLFGEGALSTAFLPAFVNELQSAGMAAAARLASAVFVLLALGLSLLVLAGELVLLVCDWSFSGTAETRLLLHLTQLLLPYVVLICLTARFCAVLHALERFAWPAVVPILLNVGWLAGIWLVAPRFDTPHEQVFAVSVSILAAGLLQLAAPLPALHRAGVRFDRAWRTAAPQVRRLLRGILPVLVGLSITQLNVVADSLIAWGFAAPESAAATLPLPGSPRYPLSAGTASALYFGQRMYQFPLGVFGVALGTVLFPLLARHAQRGEFDRLRGDLGLGLRLVLTVGLPASAGLILLAQPLARLFFEYGAFDALDTRQTAAMIRAYAAGVWAYCGLLIVQRGYYAVGDRTTPLRIGLAAMVLNLTLNLSLIWVWGGPALAIGTAVTACVQLVASVWAIQFSFGRLDWPAIATTGWKAAACTALMAAACWTTLSAFDPAPAEFWLRLCRVFVPFAAALAAYAIAARLVGLHEVAWLLGRRAGEADSEDS